MHAARQLGGECRIDHAMPFEPALPAERLRHDGDSKMRLPAWPVTGVTGVLVDSSSTFRLSGSKAVVNFSVMTSWRRVISATGTTCFYLSRLEARRANPA